MRLLTLVALACSAWAQLVPEVRGLANQGNFAAAEKLLNDAAKSGKGPEWLEAYSWLARGALNNKQYDKAEQYAAKTREMCLAELSKRKLDAEPRLPIALGASQEVHAQSLAAQGRRSEGVGFLTAELKAYRDTSIRTRIQKNLNLLTLEGAPAPPLASKEWLNAQPKALSAYRGKTVLLFFWAHWCGDCKAQAPILAKLQGELESKGLVIIAPTRYYGYAARGEDATPEVEKKHAEKILAESYSSLARMPVPIDNETFMNYGSSTTPTLVLVDRKGIVRMYRPGKMTYEELSAKLRDVMTAS